MSSQAQNDNGRVSGKHNRSFGLYNFAPFYFAKKEGIGFLSLCLTRVGLPIQADNLYLMVDNKRFPLRLYLGAGIPLFAGFRLNVSTAFFPLEDILDMNIQNKVFLCDGDNKGSDDNSDREERTARILYDAFNLRKTFLRTAAVLPSQKHNTTVFFRQSERNVLMITNRKYLASDQRKYQFMMWFARWAARIPVGRKSALLYEKEAAHYEESAKAVFERLVDLGYKRAYFVLDKSHPRFSEIEEKYKKYIIEKDTFRHYLHFFRTRKFIGTEAIQHAIALRTPSSSVLRKLRQSRKGKADFAFLQHGVVCMVTFALDLREGFRKTGNGLKRVVVSSHNEAGHFIEYAGYSPEDMYITGLPKFDFSIKNTDADKIVIMPTWRRWEANAMKNNFSQTRYYQLLEDIIRAVPPELQEKIVIKPHPLLVSYLKGAEIDLGVVFDTETSYDELLRKTALLITDYSSISTDSFFRGSNVIFYWNQLEECLQEYGKNAWLILNEDTIFGDVCHSAEELKIAIPKRYSSPQSEEYKLRFRQVVEFDDRRNTDRVIEHLCSDGFVTRHTNGRY